MVVTEEEVVEAALLRYAQQRAARWGAARFRAEFERREDEERRLKEAEARNYGLPSALPMRERPIPAPELVDESVRDRAVSGPHDGSGFKRPKPMRHPDVPCPPADVPMEGRRARRREKKRARPRDDAMWLPTAAEIERMSPAGRRLYGIDPS
jgi:hypothetical protein